jgi:hypothetical protein
MGHWKESYDNFGGAKVRAGAHPLTSAVRASSSG